VHDEAKALWLKTWPKQIELYTIPLYQYDQFAQVISERDALQAKLDRLMLEYCPEDMSKEQMAEWEKHQRVVPEGWELVPVDPTEGMSRAGIAAFHNPENQHGAVLDEVYAAMLSAAPQPDRKE